MIMIVILTLCIAMWHFDCIQKLSKLFRNFFFVLVILYNMLSIAI